MLIALNRIGSYYLKNEFHQEVQKFLEHLANSVLSTVAARSNIGQGINCFCAAIFIGGDNHADFHVPGLVLDGLLEKGWVRGNDFEACRAEY